MSKENKGTYITVTLIVLLIVLFTLAIGVVIGVFAVSEPDASNLQFWSSLGDALNPLIGFISAVLVAAGLFYTARDFRLARKEFEVSNNQLARANRLTEYNMLAGEKHELKTKYLDRIRVLISRVDEHKFTEGLELILIQNSIEDQYSIPLIRDDRWVVDSFKDLYDFLEFDQLRVSEEWVIGELELIKLHNLIGVVRELYSEIEDYVENFDNSLEIKYQVNINIIEKIECILDINILMLLENEDSTEKGISSVREQLEIKELSCINSVI